MTLNIEVPEELYRKASEIAAAEHASVDEIFTSAFAEQLAAWERLKQRATEGGRKRFLAVMTKVPDVDPEPFDRPR